MEETVQCSICGYKSASLGNHLNKIHSITAKDYRKRYGGETTSESLKSKYSSWQKGKTKGKQTKEHKKKVSKSKKGKKLSAEHKQKLSDAKKGKRPEHLYTKEVKDKISSSLKGRSITWGDKISTSLTGFRHTEDTKRLMKESRIKVLSSRKSNVVSGIEIKCSNFLRELCVSFVHQYPLGDIGVADFLVECTDGIPRFIECNGDYWHGHPHKYKSLNDMQKRRQASDGRKLEYLGDCILWLWESDINNNPALCKELISKFVGGQLATRLNSYEWSDEDGC